MTDQQPGQSRVYTVGISAVDGERSYDIVTPSAKEALAFLQRYDHEGSSVAGSLILRRTPPAVDEPDVQIIEQFDNSESLYKYLMLKQIEEMPSRG